MIPVAERVAKALVLVREHGGSLYDGLYLSLARALDAPVVTSDARWPTSPSPPRCGHA